MTRLFSFLPLHLLLCAAIGGTGILSPTPVSAQVAAQEVAAQSTAGTAVAPTARQQAWLRATPEQRLKLAEELGEAGARMMAKKQGWQPLVDGLNKSIPQGPDQVYRTVDGMIHVVEAKGGSGQLSHAYGHPQATPEWAVKSAERVLRSAKSSPAERDAARAIIESASKGKLRVHVIRTSHVLGEPSRAVVEQTLACTDDAARLAKAAMGGSTRQGATVAGQAAAKTGDTASGAATAARNAVRTTQPVGQLGDDAAAGAARAGSRTLRTAAKGAIVVGVAVDAGFRVNDGLQTEERFGRGEITHEEREIEHACNAAGMVGGWGGALAGGKLGALGGGAAGSAVAPGPGTAVGTIAGGIAGGVAGYIGGEKAAEAGADWAVGKVHAAGTTMTDLSGRAWDGTKDTAATTADAGKRAWHWTCGKTAGAWNWAWGN
jgi:hypothetical protein